MGERDWRHPALLHQQAHDQRTGGGGFSTNFANTLEAHKIGMQLGRASGSYVEDMGAIPDPVQRLADYAGPIAAYAWQLHRWGFRDTGVVLYEAEHIVAAPPGENVWLIRLERFLLASRDKVNDWLRKQQL